MANEKYFLRYSKIINRVKVGDYPSLSTLLDYLSESGFTIDKRTFNRDKIAIEDLFETEIIYSRARNGYYINTEDVNSLYSKKLQETLDLFSSIKIAGKNDELIDFDKRISIGTEHLNFILETIKNSLQLTFTHKKYQEDSSTNRTVEPYMLKESQGRWYLVAKDLKDKRIKTFALDRISSVAHNKNGTFKKPPTLDLKNYFKNSFGIINLNAPEEIIITVYGNNSSFIKSYPLHNSQKVVEENNESITFSLNLSIAPDFVMEIMKYTADLEVIKPIHLRNTIRKNYLKAIDRNS